MFRANDGHMTFLQRRINIDTKSPHRARDYIFTFSAHLENKAIVLTIET